jgi:hypothetical protein
MKPHEIERSCFITLKRHDRTRLPEFIGRIDALSLSWLTRSIIIKFDAIDGEQCTPPWWWTSTGGAWGCYMSHLRVLEKMMSNKNASVIIFEDDAFFCDNFNDEMETYLEHLPDDWEMAYLGGQHIVVPTKVNDYVSRAKDVRGTHAYMLQGNGIMKLYQHLTDFVRLAIHHDLRLNARRSKEAIMPSVFPRKQLDEWIGELVGSGNIKAYAPMGWMVGQVGGVSSVSGVEKKTYIG